MATLEALEILKMIDEDSDWNDSDEEGESGSDGEYSEEDDEIDYLATAQAHDDGFQDWEPPLSDDEEDGRSYQGNVSKTSQIEARTTEEDDALRIASATDGTTAEEHYLMAELRETDGLSLLSEADREVWELDGDDEEVRKEDGISRGSSINDAGPTTLGFSNTNSDSEVSTRLGLL